MKLNVIACWTRKKTENPNRTQKVGIYCGNEKPKASKDFLSAFVGELNDLCENGFKFNGHTGYLGCGKCTQEGEYVERRVTFPEVNCAPRTDKSFGEKHDEDHHHSPSELEGLMLDFGRY
ncbi:hypothetical protein Fcan01_16567 [Folsomia candida]|uniref:Uncharacterized protein n=1 Tax=Folsomia candida TaxID=158441 RepID=A0A226DW32_FOLCA|nr:hypothetical protein Fcan01_16567 [Folsomia candida]